jgi:hypothetical protein
MKSNPRLICDALPKDSLHHFRMSSALFYKVSCLFPGDKVFSLLQIADFGSEIEKSDQQVPRPAIAG